MTIKFKKTDILYLLILLLMIAFKYLPINRTEKQTINRHEFVDLGLPSGTKWATCNLGGKKATDRGHFFAWGETNPKRNYAIVTYQWVGRD